MKLELPYQKVISIDYFCQQMEGTKRSEIEAGMRVMVVLKPDQRSGKLTEGVVKTILTKSSNHPHGIKVMLESGMVGRVRKIVE